MWAERGQLPLNVDELGVIDMDSQYEAGAEPVKWWDSLRKQACRQHVSARTRGEWPNPNWFRAGSTTG